MNGEKFEFFMLKYKLEKKFLKKCFQSSFMIVKRLSVCYKLNFALLRKFLDSDTSNEPEAGFVLFRTHQPP